MEYTVDEVYGLSRNIPLNYVERRDVDERLRCNLNRDKHITIFGSSKQGKTCLRKHCLNENDYILVQCSNRWSLSDLNANILKRAGYELTESTNVTYEGKAKVSASVKILDATLGGEAGGGATKNVTHRQLELDLSDADLIERRRGRITVPNSIFVKVPTVQKCSPAWNDFVPSDGTEMISSMEQKCSTNQRYKNNLKDSHLIKTTAAPLTFGEYHNVFLTEKEYKQLKADFFGLDSLIEQLSAYIQSTGKKYADHAATLRIWAKRQKSEQKQAPSIPDYTFREGESL